MLPGIQNELRVPLATLVGEVSVAAERSDNALAATRSIVDGGSHDFGLFGAAQTESTASAALADYAREGFELAVGSAGGGVPHSLRGTLARLEGSQAAARDAAEHLFDPELVNPGHARLEIANLGLHRVDEELRAATGITSAEGRAALDDLEVARTLDYELPYARY